MLLLPGAATRDASATPSLTTALPITSLASRPAWSTSTYAVSRRRFVACCEIKTSRASAGAVLPDVRDVGGELDDEGTAIQIFCSADGANIQVPHRLHAINERG
jgi:hypothetical protein